MAPARHRFCLKEHAVNSPMTRRQLPDFASRPPGSRPFRFVYFTGPGDHHTHAAYHQQLVTAEMLLQRLVHARARGIAPVKRHLHDAIERDGFQRPGPDRRLIDPVELMRWVDRDGFNRPRPLSREQLVQELIARQGMSLLRAISLASSRSRALPGADQAWLETRARLPCLQRPLNGSEYRTLVRALEAAWAAPRGNAGDGAANAAIALRAAAQLGWLHPEYAASPFHGAALSLAYRTAHHACLARRAAFAGAAELRLRFSHAPPQLKMEAKLARQRTQHAALLADPVRWRLAQPPAAAMSLRTAMAA